LSSSLEDLNKQSTKQSSALKTSNYYGKSNRTIPNLKEKIKEAYQTVDSNKFNHLSAQIGRNRAQF